MDLLAYFFSAVSCMAVCLGPRFEHTPCCQELLSLYLSCVQDCGLSPDDTEALAAANASVSVGYLARAVVNSVLQGASTELIPTTHPTCLVS